MTLYARDLSHYYHLYEEQLLRLHALMAQGRGSSEEARELREEMDAPGMELTTDEIERVKGISADLYMLTDQEIYQPVQGVRPSPGELRRRVEDAWQGERWDEALALPRLGPVDLPPAEVAYLRARCYERLGHVAVALLFMRHAAALEPQRASYAFEAADLLRRAGQPAAA